MESYQNFLERIYSFEKENMAFGNPIDFFADRNAFENQYFHANPSVQQKVNENNTFKPFYGDTIVFNLDSATKKTLSGLVDTLYEAAPQCFCEKLLPSTFHMTLHDLSNSPNLPDVAAEIFHNELRALEQAKRISVSQIKMNSTYIFNMVGTSLVLGLTPADETEHHKLMTLYELFDSIHPLPYPLTPHITLAYYNVHGFKILPAQALEDTINKFNKTHLELVLDVKQLYYQKFLSMNHYINVLNLGEFLT